MLYFNNLEDENLNFRGLCGQLPEENTLTNKHPHSNYKSNLCCVFYVQEVRWSHNIHKYVITLLILRNVFWGGGVRRGARGEWPLFPNVANIYQCMQKSMIWWVIGEEALCLNCACFDSAPSPVSPVLETLPIVKSTTWQGVRPFLSYVYTLVYHLLEHKFGKGSIYDPWIFKVCGLCVLWGYISSNLNVTLKKYSETYFNASGMIFESKLHLLWIQIILKPWEYKTLGNVHNLYVSVGNTLG